MLAVLPLVFPALLLSRRGLLRPSLVPLLVRSQLTRLLARPPPLLAALPAALLVPLQLNLTTAVQELRLVLVVPLVPLHYNLVLVVLLVLLVQVVLQAQLFFGHKLVAPSLLPVRAVLLVQ